jgi:hypothetical protein
MSIVLDFLVSDAFARSQGAIDFPAHFIEGYAYLQSKFYGDRPGRFFDRNDAVLWLPRRLLKTGSVELNYLTARGGKGLYVALTNQSRETVTTEIAFNAEVLPAAAAKIYRVRALGDAATPAAARELREGRMTVTVPPMGLAAFEIEGLVVTPKFQDRLVAATKADAWQRDYLELSFGHARAMVLNFGAAASTAFVYLQDDDAKFKQVSLTYEVAGKRETVTDAAYPFEFTVPLAREAREFRFELSGVGVDGADVQGESAALVK